MNIALSQLSNLDQRVNEATQPNAGGNQDQGRQPIYIDLTGPDLIDLVNCVNNVCQPGSCDFCNFRHQSICDCNPPVVVDLTQAGDVAADAADEPGDPVNAEVQAWAALLDAEVALHRNSLGLLDEFALVCRLKKKFPLHYTVFRQSSSHLGHEGNVERVFSGAKTRADAKMRSSMLRLVTKTGGRKNRYKLTVVAIWSRYQEKYKGLSTYQNSDSETDCYSSDSSDSDSD